MPPIWSHYEQLRPDQLADVVRRSPIAFWPLGLLEHHGWHLPVGFDGVKAERICQRIAERTGGVLLPTMWWGGNGGHGDFRWTHYQPQEAWEAILVNTVQQLIRFGFRALVLLAGHYPWKSTLDRHLPSIQQEHPDVLLVWGTEMDIAAPEVRLPGDHAACEETTYGLALLPEWVDLGALVPGRDASVWPGAQAPPQAQRHPGVCYETSHPLFSQMGEDARLASAQVGEERIGRLVEAVVSRIARHLRIALEESS